MMRTADSRPTPGSRIGRIPSLLVVGILAVATAVSGFAQSSGGRGQSAVLPTDSGSDDWKQARGLVDALEAVPLMQALARQERDSRGAARAAFWLGLYRYGSGDPGAALAFFDLAAAGGGDPEVTRQARVWAHQCRQLAGEVAPVDTPLVGELTDVFEVREAIMGGDALVRGGRPLDALRSYLAVEGEARRLGCLSLLYYRVGLIVAAATASDGQHDGLLDWKTLAGWEPNVSASPERALISGLRHARTRLRSAGAPPSPFAEPEVEPVRTPETQRAASEFPDSLFAAEPDTGQRPSLDAGLPGPEVGRRNQEAADPIFVLQLGAYRDRERARREMERLTTRSLSVRLVEKTQEDGGSLYLIWLGRCASREEARALADRVLPGIDYQIALGSR